MTTKEFFARHYGSLSTGSFALGVLILIAVFGDDISVLTEPQPPEKAAPSTPAPVAAAPPPAQTAPSSDDSTAPETNPLEDALAAEAAKANERSEAASKPIVDDQREADAAPSSSQEASTPANAM